MKRTLITVFVVNGVTCMLGVISSASHLQPILVALNSTFAACAFFIAGAVTAEKAKP